MTQATDWTEMPFFLAVARTGSLRAAAESTGATHATVDRHLKALETAYGVRLFERSRRGLKLTSAGEALVPMAQDAEAAMIGARSRLQGLDREAAGTVRVSLPPALANEVTGPIFAAFSDKYPDIELAFDISNTIQDFSRNETDVSLRVAREVSDDAVGRKLFDIAVSTYASPEYIDAEIANAGPKGEGLTWIGWNDEGPYPDWVRNSPFPRAQIRHKVPDVVFQLSMIQQGAGMAVLPVYYEHIYAGIRRVPGTEIETGRSMWLLLHTDLRRTTRVRLLVDFLAEALKAQRRRYAEPLT